MAAESPSEVTFTLTLDGERVDADVVASTLKDLESLLKDIERQVRGVEHAKVQWAWGDESPEITLVATVNGVSAHELLRIVDDAQDGFAVR